MPTQPQLNHDERIADLLVRLYPTFTPRERGDALVDATTFVTVLLGLVERESRVRTGGISIVGEEPTSGEASNSS